MTLPYPQEDLLQRPDPDVHISLHRLDIYDKIDSLDVTTTTRRVIWVPSVSLHGLLRSNQGLVLAPSITQYLSTSPLHVPDMRTKASVSGRGATSALSEFLTDDDGLPLLDTTSIYLDTSSTLTEEDNQLSFRSLSRRGTVMSMRSVQTLDSVAPAMSSGLAMPLSVLCDFIGQCASLERASILSVECHKQWSTFGILHRFLIFHLRRPNRSDVWLRMDRRPTQGVAFPKLVFGAGRTEANDTASLAATREELLNGPNKQPENLLTFASPPNLGAFRFFLSVISEELLEYRVWPANCWFMCSLLQELLAESSGGLFEIGRPTHPDLAKNIRTRIFERVFHVPAGASMRSLLRTILKRNGGPEGKERQQLVSAFKLAKDVESAPPIGEGDQAHSRRDSQLITLSDAFHAISRYLDETTACQLACRAAALTRQLHARNPEAHLQRHIAALHLHATRLLAAGRTIDAFHVCTETLELLKTPVPDADRELPRVPPPSLYRLTMTPEETQMSSSLNFAVRVFRVSYEQDPVAYYKTYIRSLDLYSQYLYRARLSHAAQDAELQIVSVYRAIHRRDPQKYYAEFGETLRAYEGKFAQGVDDDGDFSGPKLIEDADEWATRLGMRKERVEVFRSLYKLDPARYHEDLRGALHAYAELLSASGDTWESLETFSAATRIDHRHSASAPGPGGEDGNDEDRIERLQEHARTLRTLATSSRKGSLPVAV